jgi:hypothetical protein
MFVFSRKSRESVVVGESDGFQAEKKLDEFAREIKL